MQRLWRLVGELRFLGGAGAETPPAHFSPAAIAVRRAVHASLLKVEEDIERLRFNRAVAQVHDLANKLGAAVGAVESADIAPDMRYAFREAAEILVLLFAPMMPHLAEECWSRLGHEDLVSEAPWPVADRALVKEDTIELPVQVNGKKRADLVIDRAAGAAAIEAAALSLEAVQRALEGRPVKKVIIVPQRIVNVVA